LLHLLQQTVNPLFSLAAAIRDWLCISKQLQEPPRQRINQLSRLTSAPLS
jgi:hypothetical protein